MKLIDRAKNFGKRLVGTFLLAVVSSVFFYMAIQLSDSIELVENLATIILLVVCFCGCSVLGLSSTVWAIAILFGWED